MKGNSKGWKNHQKTLRQSEIEVLLNENEIEIKTHASQKNIYIGISFKNALLNNEDAI